MLFGMADQAHSQIHFVIGGPIRALKVNARLGLIMVGRNARGRPATVHGKAYHHIDTSNGRVDATGLPPRFIVCLHQRERVRRASFVAHLFLRRREADAVGPVVNGNGL